MKVYIKNYTPTAARESFAKDIVSTFPQFSYNGGNGESPLEIHRTVLTTLLKDRASFA